jgi:hypothetical protein
MRVLTNEQRVKRGRQVGTVMFFFSLFILTGGLIFTNFIAISDEALLLVPCMIMPIGLVSTIVSIRLTNTYVRQPRPEKALRDGLQGINRRSVLLHYFPTANHILITPHGVYALTVRFQMTRFRVEGERWTNYKSRGPLGPFFLFMKQEQLGEPFEDARKDQAALQAVLDEALPESGIEVQPVVVFIHPRAEVEIENPALPVAYASQKKKPSLKAVLREDKRDKQRDRFEALNDDEIAILEDALVAKLPPKQQELVIEEED